MAIAAPAGEWYKVQPKMYRALFLACDTALIARQVLVWDVPLKALDKVPKNGLRSPGVLVLEDGRRFALKAVYNASGSLHALSTQQSQSLPECPLWDRP